MDLIVRAVFALIWFLAVHKWGDWHNWRRYYPTMLFFILGNFIYLVIFYNKPLWKLQSQYIHYPFPDFYMSFVIFTCSMLIFLPHYPSGFGKQVIYNLLWAALYTLIEFTYLTIGLIKHANGWSIWLSALHNSYQFPILKLHQEKPLWAWVLAVIIITIFVNAFDIPFLKD